MSYIEGNNNLDDESTLKDRYLTFHLADDILAIEIRYVTEIISMQAITKVPKVADFVEGVINLRGKIIPVINIRTKFNVEKIDFDYQTNIIIVNYKDTIVGLIIDDVDEVLTIPHEDISDYNPERKTEQDNYITGVAKINNDVKLIVSCKKILDGDSKTV